MSEKTKQEIKESINKLANANLKFTIENELEFAKVAVKNAEQKLEQVKQENKRLLEIINAKPLETVDMDSAFEIEKLKEQLQAKEQKILTLINKNNRLSEQLNQTKIILRGKNDQYNWAMRKYQELKKQYNCYACGTCKGREDYKNMKRHCEKAI